MTLYKTPSGEEDFSLAYLPVSIPVTQNCVLTVPFSWGAISVTICSFYLWYSNILSSFLYRVISLWERKLFLALGRAFSLQSSTMLLQCQVLNHFRSNPVILSIFFVLCAVSVLSMWYSLDHLKFYIIRMVSN